jgi:hypothetical protein
MRLARATPTTPRLLLLLVLAVGLAAMACVQPPGASSPSGPVGGPEFSAILVNSDLAVGVNRVAFGLVDRDNMPVRTAQAQVETVYFPPGVDEGVVRQTATAEFRTWPAGQRGVYVTTLDFDVPGEGTKETPALWGLRITAMDDEGKTIEAQTVARVAARSKSPGLGQPAPRSVTPTVADHPDLSTISSAPVPDPDLYRLSVHEALDDGKPLVVTFSTPAFCVTATCGPQLDVITGLKEQHGGAVNFVHVEVVGDPHLLNEGRPAARWVPAVEEWGLLSEPWTFVVDRDGLVRAKFEQFTPAQDIEAALLEVLP